MTEHTKAMCTHLKCACRSIPSLPVAFDLMLRKDAMQISRFKEDANILSKREEKEKDDLK